MKLASLLPAALLLGIGVIFTGQGLGIIRGSSMTGSPFWMVVGLLMIIGAVIVLRRGRRAG
ncbi:MAG: LPXTG cell wall anchor domain-containing protein [Candidatus Dormibacteria bacterium]